jgi:transcription initiation factor TFIIH subunit 2
LPIFVLPLKNNFLLKFQLLHNFLEEFFDQNPISQMGIIIMKNKRAERVSELTGTAKKHTQVLFRLSK